MWWVHVHLSRYTITKHVKYARDIVLAYPLMYTNDIECSILYDKVYKLYSCISMRKCNYYMHNMAESPTAN